MLSTPGVTGGESCILSFSLFFGGHTLYIYIYMFFFFFQEPVELLGPVEIHVRRTESVNGVLPTYIRI